MPFILESSASSLCNSSPNYSQSNNMPSFNIFRRKSRHNSGFGRTSSTLSKASAKAPSPTPLPTSPFAAFSAPTRRPANPATVANPFATPSANSDAPPAYSAPATSIASSTDNPYAFLSTFDTIFLIDDSGSMAGRSWRETSQALAAVTPICTAHDKDGIDIYFLNAKDDESYKNITRPADVQRVFDTVRPGGGTPTGTRLNAILKPYLKECEAKKANFDNVKPLNIIVITDGVPTDDPESVIVSVAKKLDKLEAPPWQVGIQFFQVGDERGAAEALQELDDGIKDMVVGGCRDIVDTVPWKGSNSTGLNADGILKVVLGSVNKRLDRKRVSIDGRPGQLPS